MRYLINVNPFIVDTEDEDISSIINEAYDRASWCSSVSPSLEQIAEMVEEVMREEECSLIYDDCILSFQEIMLMTHSALKQNYACFYDDGVIKNCAQIELFPELGGEVNVRRKSIDCLSDGDIY